MTDTDITVKPVEGLLVSKRLDHPSELIYGRWLVDGGAGLDVDAFARALESELKGTIRDMRAFGPCAPVDTWAVDAYDYSPADENEDFHLRQKRPEIASIVRHFLDDWAP